MSKPGAIAEAAARDTFGMLPMCKRLYVKHQHVYAFPQSYQVEELRNDVAEWVPQTSPI